MSQLLPVHPALLTAAVIVAAVALFMTEFFPIDLTAGLIMAALILLGLLTPEEGVAGFSNSATVTVASVLVLSAGLQRTGVVDAIGYRIMAISGGDPRRYLVVMMVSVGLLSAFINNTAAVAIFLPVVLSSARAMRVSPSRLLVPLAFASQFGGMSTLIGTSTNLLVSSLAASEGQAPIGMFELTPIGLVMFAAGVIYFATLGQRLIPDREGNGGLEEELRSRVYMTEIRIPAGSPLIGRGVEEIRLVQHEKLRASRVIRGTKGVPVEEAGGLQEGDAVLVEGPLEELAKLKGAKEFDLAPDVIKAESRPGEASFMEVLVPRGSYLVGKTLRMAAFEGRYQARVMAVRRHGKRLGTKLDHVRLLAGDILVLQGDEAVLKDLAGERDLALITSARVPVLRRERLAVSLAIMAGVVGLAAAGVLPIAVTAVSGALLMVALGILGLEEAYGAVDARVLLMLASSVALATAMENSGLAAMIVDASMGFMRGLHPVALVTIFYMLTILVTELTASNASAVIMSRVAMSLAEALGVSARPLLVAVTYSASNNFLSPKDDQTNMMVYGPGGYRFTDYLAAGVPLVVLFLVLNVLLIPALFPF